MFAALTAAARVLAIVGASDLAASLLASRSLFAVMVQAFIAEMGASRLLGIDWQGPPDAGRRRRLFLLAAVALLAGVLPSAIAMLLFHARVTLTPSLSMLLVGGVAAVASSFRDELLFRALPLSLFWGRISAARLVALVVIVDVAHVAGANGHLSRLVLHEVGLASIGATLWVFSGGAWAAIAFSAVWRFVSETALAGGFCSVEGSDRTREVLAPMFLVVCAASLHIFPNVRSRLHF